MSKFTSFANDLLAAEYDTGAAGTLALGPVSARVSYTLPIRVGLTQTMCTAAGIGTEFVGGSYGRQSLAGAMGVPAAQSVTNSGAAITFANMPGGTWADVFTADSTATPKLMNFRGGASLAKTINAGDTALIPASSFTGSES